MFTLIIIVLAVAFGFGLFKHLSAKNKEITAKRISNATVYGVTFAAKTAKETIKGANAIGQVASLHLELQGQDRLNKWEAYNKELAERGGAKKEALRDHSEVCKTIGLGSFNDDMAAKIAAMKAELASRQSN